MEKQPWSSLRALMSSLDLWNVDSHRGILTVQGRKIGIFASFRDFKDGCETYDERGDHLHIENISSLLDLLRTRTGTTLWYNLLGRKNHSTEPLGLREEEYLVDSHFLMYDPNPPDVVALHVLKKANRPPGLVRKFLRIFADVKKYQPHLQLHLWLCNSMVRTDRRIFLATNLRLKFSREAKPITINSYGRIPHILFPRNFAEARSLKSRKLEVSAHLNVRSAISLYWFLACQHHLCFDRQVQHIGLLARLSWKLPWDSLGTGI
jgi:hypothetical protein